MWRGTVPLTVAALALCSTTSAYKYKVKYTFDSNHDNQELSEGPMFAKLDVRLRLADIARKLANSRRAFTDAIRG